MPRGGDTVAIGELTHTALIRFLKLIERSKNAVSEYQKLWLTPAEAAGVLGDTTDAIYRNIRLNQFPFRFERLGKRIKISARDLGLIPGSNTQSDEARNQEETLASAA
jgi:hypothetical protein